MIRFDKVSFTYQESLQNGGLRDVDLTINKGECVLLCGRSGCGKTTLTRLVNGLIPYFYPGEVTGTTYVDGKDIQDYPMYEVSEHVGSVFQNPRSQFFNVDTDSEISFGMENLSYPREKMKERISKTVADLDIAHLTGRSIFELSGGEKQKVAFASIYLCLDNDEAGQSAAKRISDKLFIKGIQHEILVPIHKDWNEDLLYPVEESEAEEPCQMLQL